MILFTLCLLAMLGPAPAATDFSGQWQGTFIAFPGGIMTRTTAFLTLRQFGDVVQGSFGANINDQIRIRSASIQGDTITLTLPGMEMRLTLKDEIMDGPAKLSTDPGQRVAVLVKRKERGNGGATTPERPSATGHIETIENFAIPQLNRQRRLFIYLPPDYSKSKNRYPVLYMQDGQNLFDLTTSDRGEWQVDETLEALFKERKTRGVIVVGVESGASTRAQEYLPASLGVLANAEGEKYAEFVVKTLKPYIDAHYRTLPDREHTGVAGASAGAQISFFMATEYPETFSKAGALGFIMGRGAKEQIEKWRATHKKQAGMKIYLHVGTEENTGAPGGNQANVDNLKLQYEALRSLGYTDAEVKLDIEAGAHQQEVFWAKRFPQMFAWLFE